MDIAVAAGGPPRSCAVGDHERCRPGTHPPPDRRGNAVVPDAEDALTKDDLAPEDPPAAAPAIGDPDKKRDPRPIPAHGEMASREQLREAVLAVRDLDQLAERACRAHDGTVALGRAAERRTPQGLRTSNRDPLPSIEGSGHCSSAGASLSPGRRVPPSTQQCPTTGAVASTAAGALLCAGPAGPGVRPLVRVRRTRRRRSARGARGCRVRSGCVGGSA